MASVCSPSIGRRCSGSQPSRIDSPRRRSLTRPGTTASPSAQSRLPELPPDTVPIVRPNRSSIEPASADSSPMFAASGDTPLWHARLVPMPARTTAGSRCTSRAMPMRSPGRMPSRRSPSSTMSTTRWVRPVASAAAASAVITSSSVLKLTVAEATTRSTWLSIGERTRISGAVTPAPRSRSMFSMRESPSERTPARSMAPATSGDPSVALVMPVTEIPRGDSRSTRVRALWWSLRRSISSRGAFIARRRRASPAAPGRRRGPSPPAGPASGSAHRWRARPARPRTSRWPR